MFKKDSYQPQTREQDQISDMQTQWICKAICQMSIHLTTAPPALRGRGTNPSCISLYAPIPDFDAKGLYMNKKKMLAAKKQTIIWERWNQNRYLKSRLPGL